MLMKNSNDTIGNRTRDRVIFGYHVRQGKYMFLFRRKSRMVMAPTYPPIRLVPVIFAGLNQPGLEVSHPSPSSAKFKNEWSYTYILHTFLHVVGR
jgi:hypothetical protein